MISLLSSSNKSYEKFNTLLSSSQKIYGEFNNYFSSDVLPKNKLLLKSFSTEVEYCCRKPPTEFSKSEIIFIGMNEFKEIKSTETFDLDVYHLILNNYLINHAKSKTYIYDIKSLNCVGNIILFREISSFISIK